MKKAVAIFLLAVYELAAFGATIHAHYCMNRLISFSVLPGNPNICSNCGMPKAKSHGCCHDEQHQVKADADHQPAFSNFPSHNFSGQAIITPSLYICPPGAHSAIAVKAISHAPPGTAANKLYLLHQVFLI